MGRTWGALFLFLCVASSAFGVESAIRIRSYLCNQPEAALESAGTLVRYAGHSYVLTSHWGVLEETKNVCHEVGVGAERHEARLFTLDWAAGFALLEVEGLDATIDLEEVHSPEVPSTTVTVDGGLGKVVNGRIASTKSTRHHFPAISSAFELSSSEKLDVSFVGAPVKGEHLYGIVSSQRIELVPGSRSLIREWQNKDTAESNLLFVLPLSKIRERLQQIAGRAPQTFQPAASKLGKRDRLYIGPLEWRIDCPPGAGLPPKDDIGPIGGPDGVGVGGSMKGTETCSSSLLPQKETELAAPDFVAPAIWEGWMKLMEQPRTFDVPFLYGRTPGKDIARYPFFSLNHFFIENKLAEHTPVFLLKEGPAATVTPELEALRAENQKFRALLVETYSLISNRDDERMAYRAFYALSLLLDSNQWKVVSGFDVQRAIGELDNTSFGQNVSYQGQSLRTVVQAEFNELFRKFMKVRNP